MSVEQHTLELLAISRAQPFYYDHDAAKFHFGEQVLSVNEIPEFGSSHATGSAMTADDAAMLYENTPFVHNHVHPIGLPASMDFLKNGWTQALENETNEVIADVFMDTTDRFERTERQRLLSMRAFSTMRRVDSGDAILTTVGACACLGPDFSAMFTHSEAGIAEYTYHNIDRPEQRLSLMAGLGHIARRANEWL